MCRFGKKLVVAYLVAFLTWGQAMASSKREVAVVEVFETSSSRQGIELRHKLEKKLIQSKKVGVVPPEKIAAYLNKKEISPGDLNSGDKLYLDAEARFFNFELKGANALLEKAVAELRGKPGIQGSLVKASLLKAQVALELGKHDTAVRAVEEAITANISATELDSYYYPPSFRRFYRRVYEGYVAKTKIVDMTVAIRGSDFAPIYINGVYRGTGPEMTVSVPDPEIFTQLVSAGNSPKSPVVKVTDSNRNNRVVVSGRSAPAAAKTVNQGVGFRDDSAGNLAQQAVWLGSAVSAGQVVLMRLEERDYLSRLTVTVVDVKKGRTSQPKQVDLMDIEEDADSAVSVAADYIIGLSRADLAAGLTKGQALTEPVLIGKKKSRSIVKIPVFWALVGVLAAGIGAGVALGMGGGGSGGPVSDTTSTTLSGPAPSSP